MVARLRARLAQEDGMTLIELLTTMAIMGFVLSAIIGVFVSGLHAEVDMNQRFQTQQAVRLALQTMRTDLRSACSMNVSNKVVTGDTVRLGYCSNSTTTWSATPLSYTTWCARSEAGAPVHYGLYRESGDDAAACALSTTTTGVREADWLTTATTSFTPVVVSGQRPELTVSIPVYADPAKASGLYKLSDTILLRNAAVSP
jgi:prepilin-type N-terminal cleavage/methylation domain-containing protein